MFLRSGFVRVTSDDIAAALGISKATLYRHFRSKEEILVAFVRETISGIIGAVEGIFADPGRTVPDRLAEVFGLLSARFATFGPLLIRDIRRSAPGLWKEIETRRRAIFGHFADLFAQGVREGVFRADLDLDLVVGMYVTLIQEFISPEALLRWGRTPGEVFRTLVSVLFQGILTDRGRRAFPEFPAAGAPARKDG